MIKKKITLYSAVLDRDAHFDLFQIVEQPLITILLFGGSGVDEDEYELRKQTLPSYFDRLLPEFEEEETPIRLLHVTAPFDVPFARFDEFPEEMKRWNDHIIHEVLFKYEYLPYYVIGFSGGVLLGFYGIHATPSCIGGAAIAVDGFPLTFQPPIHWSSDTAKNSSNMLFLNSFEDPVSQGNQENRTIQALLDTGNAQEIILPNCRHRLSDYCVKQGLGEIIRNALELAK